jgi:hypothetical protein
MKKAFIYLFTIILSLSWITKSKAQVTVEGLDPNQFVFWFYIRAEIKTNRLTKKPSYVVRTLSKTPKSGNLMKFDKDLWRNLQGGQNLVIGPFTEYIDAVRAIKMYDLAGQTDETMEKEIANFRDSTATGEYYWFFLKFQTSKRKGSYILERMPARVFSGSVKEFKQVLWEGLGFQNLNIGPFASQIEAEESKRRYRIEED